MTTPLRLAGAAALCAALLLTACAKKTDQTTTSTDTTSTQAAADAGATPAADADAAAATTAPDAGTTPAAEASNTTAPSSTMSAGGTTVTTGSGTNGSSKGGYIDLPVYPGAGELKEQAITSSSDTGSVAMKIYSTKDNAKRVAEWYKAHLPASFKGGILTAGDKTVGTWADEHTDGDQNVIVGSDSSSGTTRIQLTTKHGK